MILILLGIMLAILLLFLQYGGVFLEKIDKVKDTNNAAIVILMGSIVDRSLGATDLYKEGKAKKVLIVRSRISGYNYLKERGIFIEGDADRSKSLLKKLGIEENDIIILSGKAKSTKDEALVIMEYLKNENKIDSILLVTSRYHSLRAKLTFNKTFKNQSISIYSVPTMYDGFQANGWFRKHSIAKSVVIEYMKLMHYFLIEQFKIGK